MEGPIIVVDANETESEALRAVLEHDNYPAIALTTLEDLEERIQETACGVIIMDLDTLPVDNRFIRYLKRQKDNVYIIGLSSRPFHPELEEAVSTHLYACLGKPVDTDELLYWLKSIDKNE
jgi:DNA-binding response OmpR family regulator